MENIVTYQLPHNDNEKEIIYLLTTTGRTYLSLASNFSYELWINNKFIGTGGHRCTDTEIYIDNWNDLNTDAIITIKYQWFNYNKCCIWYRRIFPDAIFVDLNSITEWNLTVDPYITFADKICPHLSHQIIIAKSDTANQIFNLVKLDSCPYKLIPLSILRKYQHLKYYVS